MWPRKACISRGFALIFLAIGATSAAAEPKPKGMWELLTPSLEALANPEKAREFCRINPEASKCRPMSGAELLARCDSSQSTDRAYCAGTLSAMATSGSDLPEWRCVPKEAYRHPEQFRVLFVREALRTPEVLHQDARNLLFYAVAKSFPCSTPRSSFR